MRTGFPNNPKPYKTFWYQLIVSPRYRVIRHFVLLATVIFIILQSPDEQEFRSPINIWLTIGFFLYFIGCLYLNAYCFVLKFLIKGKFYSYLMLVLGLCVISFILLCVLDIILEPYRLVPSAQENKTEILTGFFEFLIFFGIAMAASSALKLFQHWLQSLEQFYTMEMNNFNLEMNLLKNQVSPHFLFNILNNVHILIEEEPKTASKMLMNLSDLLRYQIYDCESSVFLSADVTFLRDFLELEASRRDDFRFSIDHSGENREIEIPPFLFIPFVENAVKHSYTNSEPSFVEVSFCLKKQELEFTCVNSKPEMNEICSDEHRGIGLENIKRRLSLLYPGRHHLTIENAENCFSVLLLIQL
ncbi:histidine kinase [Chryseobacterium phosphatilyticum]|uniref:Histidine kinase n=2 Tax=Chryseobacterium phosphatilyticum TaxID=475075 RepID=A0A316X8G1_9FLAO|nr:histidine kinase [Chryseobacterium phosphatilyticum]